VAQVRDLPSADDLPSSFGVPFNPLMYPGASAPEMFHIIPNHPMGTPLSSNRQPFSQWGFFSGRNETGKYWVIFFMILFCKVLLPIVVFDGSIYF
jgi:hypothetical protein